MDDNTVVYYIVTCQRGGVSCENHIDQHMQAAQKTLSPKWTQYDHDDIAKYRFRACLARSDTYMY